MFKSYKSVFSRINHLAYKRSYSTQVSAKRTCLYDFHVEKKAKMVDFAGFEMPLVYADQKVSSSHNHTRKHVSIFDVSHMLQTSISGKDCVRFIESLTVSDIQGLKDNHGTLSLMTNDKGGIIDDLIITKTDTGSLYIVSNAGCIDKDLAHIKENLQSFKRQNADLELKVLSDRALLAVQGPGTAKVLQPLVECDLNELFFMTSTVTTVCGIPDCRITRCGYTGEDGVEISVDATKARYVVENMLSSQNDDVKLAGLAVRDTLRLEAGLCLYGNDITEDTTPVEAGLTWTIGKRRRDRADFPGAAIIIQHLKDKPSKKRIGFLSTGPPPRAHTPILTNCGKVIGNVTSGILSPYLSKNIAMGYVNSAYAKTGTKLKFEIRKKLIETDIVKMPFVPTNYYSNRL